MNIFCKKPLGNVDDQILNTEYASLMLGFVPLPNLLAVKYVRRLLQLIGFDCEILFKQVYFNALVRIKNNAMLAFR